MISTIDCYYLKVSFIFQIRVLSGLNLKYWYHATNLYFAFLWFAVKEKITKHMIVPILNDFSSRELYGRYDSLGIQKNKNSFQQVLHHSTETLFPVQQIIDCLQKNVLYHIWSKEMLLMIRIKSTKQQSPRSPIWHSEWDYIHRSNNQL